MKKNLMLMACVLIVAATAAQQRAHYTQYILNNYVLNPALSGIENYTDLKGSVRNQWVGFSGAPRTSYLTLHGPLGKSDYRTTATSYRVPGQNPRGNAYWETYTAAEPHHGIGMTVVSDRTGNFNRFSAAGTYAYHLGLNPTTNLSAGFSAGITMVSLNSDGKLFFGNNPSDPSVGGSAANDLKKIKPDIGFGLWLYSADYFVGISGQQIIPQKLMYVDDATLKTKGRLIPHVFFTAGYRFLVNDDVNAVPSIMVKYINGAFKDNYQAEANLKLQYRDLMWVGGSYRQFDGYAAMVGVNISNTFNVGYAYDFTKSDINTYSRGTHELVVGFLLGNKYDDSCPRAMW
jgi:type IX secretion system PorP/SprF family membrane protein